MCCISFSLPGRSSGSAVSPFCHSFSYSHHGECIALWSSRLKAGPRSEQHGRQEPGQRFVASRGHPHAHTKLILRPSIQFSLSMLASYRAGEGRDRSIPSRYRVYGGIQLEPRRPDTGWRKVDAGKSGGVTGVRRQKVEGPGI